MTLPTCQWWPYFLHSPYPTMFWRLSTHWYCCGPVEVVPGHPACVVHVEVWAGRGHDGTVGRLERHVEEQRPAAVVTPNNVPCLPDTTLLLLLLLVWSAPVPGHQVWGELPLSPPGDVLVPVPVVAHHVRGGVGPVGVPAYLYTHCIYTVSTLSTRSRGCSSWSHGSTSQGARRTLS